MRAKTVCKFESEETKRLYVGAVREENEECTKWERVAAGGSAAGG